MCNAGPPAGRLLAGVRARPREAGARGLTQARKSAAGRPIRTPGQPRSRPFRASATPRRHGCRTTTATGSAETTPARPPARRSRPPSAGRRPWRCSRSSLPAAYLVWRWGFTLDGTALWLGAAADPGRDLRLRDARAAGVLVLAHLGARVARRPSPAAAWRSDRDLRRGRGRPAPDGRRRARHPQRRRARGLGARRRRPRLGQRDVRRARRALPQPPRAARSHAKAGNINHALGYVDAEFLVTLDADHVPRPELLERMLGYMADPKVAVVQGPQAFYNRGFGHPRAHDDPLRNEQSIFFDVICPREGPPRSRLLVRLPVGAAPRRPRRRRRRRHLDGGRGRAHQHAC